MTILGLALRGTFCINPEGKLVIGQLLQCRRNADELVRKVAANVYCPNIRLKRARPTGPRRQDLEAARLVGKVYEAS